MATESKEMMEAVAAPKSSASRESSLSFKSILRELEQELGTMDLLCSNSEGVLEDATEASRLARSKQVFACLCL